MPSNPTAAVQAAMREYSRAPADSKPSDAVLAKKHKVNPSTIYRARMRMLKESQNG